MRRPDEGCYLPGSSDEGLLLVRSREDEGFDLPSHSGTVAQGATDEGCHPPGHPRVVVHGTQRGRASLWTEVLTSPG